MGSHICIMRCLCGSCASCSTDYEVPVAWSCALFSSTLVTFPYTKHMSFCLSMTAIIHQTRKYSAYNLTVYSSITFPQWKLRFSVHQIEQCYFFSMQLLRNYKGPKLELWLQMQFCIRMFHVYFCFVKSDFFCPRHIKLVPRQMCRG